MSTFVPAIQISFFVAVSAAIACLSDENAAVQLVPSEAFGTGYLRILPQLLDERPVIASGKLERYQAELWLESGGLAVCPRDLVGPDAVLGETLDDLRVTLQHWRLGD